MNNTEQKTAVSVIVIIDSREPLPSEEEISAGKTASHYSILGLPQRRSFVRSCAAKNGWDLAPELSYELGNTEHEQAGVPRLIEKLKSQNTKLVFIDDMNILRETPIAADLLSALKNNSIQLVN